MPTINNLPPLTQATGTIAFPVVDYNTDPDTTRKATFEQFRDYLETTVAVSSVAGRNGAIVLTYTDIGGLNPVASEGVPIASSSATGIVKVGSGINVSTSGTISVVPYTLNTATSLIVGGIKVGANLTITSDGTLSATSAYTLNTATTSVIGGVKIGSGINITQDGTISTVPMTTATTATLGGVIVGPGIDVDASGVISISTTTANFTGNSFTINVDEVSDYVSSSLGGLPKTAAFQIYRGTSGPASLNFTDEYYFNDQNGEITRGIFYFRSSGTYAMVGVKGLRVGVGQSELNIFGSDNSNSVLSVKGTTDYEVQVTDDDHIPNRKFVTDLFATTATSNVLGGIKIGSGITADGDGTISVATTTYVLTTATTSTLGGVLIGSGINAQGDGTISVTPYTLNTATASVLGGVLIGSGLASYGDGTIYVTGGGGGGGSPIVTQDEGSTLSTQTSSINFIGAGVTATNIADAITIRIDGGGGGGTTFTGGAVANSTQFLNAAASSSSSTGAVSIVGGLGIGGSVFVNNNVTANVVTATSAVINGVTVATSTTGALIVAGGVSVGGSVYVANTVTAVTFANAGAGTPTIQSPSSIILDAQTEVKVLGSPFTLWSRTVSELALISATVGALAYCTNESSGAVPVFYDGADWRRMTDRNIIS